MASKRYPGQTHSGSPSAGEPEYLIVGTLRRPHGVHGEMVMEIHTDFPERLVPAGFVYISPKRIKMTIRQVRPHREGLLIGFDGIDSPEAAGVFRNQLVFVTVKDRPPLPPGSYYHHQLIGFTVMDDRGEIIGNLIEILQTGANDIYVVSRPEGRQVLLPVIPSVVLNIDPSQRQIRVHLIPGLVDEPGNEANSTEA